MHITFDTPNVEAAPRKKLLRHSSKGVFQQVCRPMILFHVLETEETQTEIAKFMQKAHPKKSMIRYAFLHVHSRCFTRIHARTRTNGTYLRVHLKTNQFHVLSHASNPVQLPIMPCELECPICDLQNVKGISYITTNKSCDKNRKL